MPKIDFLTSPAGPEKTIDVPEGGMLVDICDDALAPIPFSCRSASCATCHIEVLEGASLLEPPEDEEQELLEVVGGPEESRFACQVRVRSGDGLVRLRSLDAG